MDKMRYLKVVTTEGTYTHMDIETCIKDGMLYVLEKDKPGGEVYNMKYVVKYDYEYKKEK